MMTFRSGQGHRDHGASRVSKHGEGAGRKRNEKQHGEGHIPSDGSVELPHAPCTYVLQEFSKFWVASRGIEGSSGNTARTKGVEIAKTCAERRTVTHHCGIAI